MMKRKTTTTTSILPTSNEMLQDAIGEYLNNIETPIRTSGNCKLDITSNNKNVIIELYKKLKEALVCGQGEAAWYLAQFYYNGWLVEKDILQGDFILAIGKSLDSIKCFNTSYKSDNPLSSELKQLSLVCANSISNTKVIYQKGINDVMKTNAEFAFNTHLKNTDLKDMFDISKSEASSISTASAPLLSMSKTIEQNTARRATQSDIKDLTRQKGKAYYKQTPHIREIEDENYDSAKKEVDNEQTLLMGHGPDDGGCTCLII